uniref:Uncharacterized protein n=1 Tax=Avena sativa TaxID=4498 RepID=A0ACD5TR68_AVESA
MSSRRPPLHFILLLLLAYYCSTHTAANGGITVQCLPDQAASLLQLNRSFHNPNLSSWKHDTDCCHWEGVGCDRASGQVITLDLGDFNLQRKGGLSPALFNLTSLTNLSLAGNDFHQASLPNFGFEQLTNLLSLNLSATSLAGQIPIGISHLKSLRTLDFSVNYGLFFSEPSFHMVLGNLSNLRELYLDGVDISSDGTTWSSSLGNYVPRLQHLSLDACGLSGHIQSSFSRLQSLQSITLSANRISGKVPQFLANFSSLSTLDLSGNDFEGQFPTKIFQLKKLRSIDLSWNAGLSGHLPSFPVENSLEFLKLMETNFTVVIPTSFVNLRFLTFLGLSMAEVTEGDISLISKLPSLQSLTLYGSGSEKPNFSWIANIESLIDLYLASHNFSTPIPSWIANLTSLTRLGLIDCSLYGKIPTWIGNLTNLSTLYLHGNNLQGEIPNTVLALPVLQDLILRYNKLSGPIGDIPTPLSSPLSSIDLSMNQLTGPLPKSFFRLKHLAFLLIESNRLSDTIDLSVFWRIKSLTYLVLSNNMLSITDIEGDNILHSPSKVYFLGLASCNLTKLPGSLRYLDKVSGLDLSSNQISGIIPSWIWDNWRWQLYYLNLSHNIFTTLENSPSLVHLPRLNFLDLSSNRLQGSIPIPVTSYPGGLLDYSNNNFSSIVPNFGRYIKSSYLNLSKNKLNGHVPYSICSTSELDILDISYNNFSGLVPSCLIESGKLSVLKLRENHFEGMFPENIRQGCMLQTIDLNGNQLVGKLPRSLLHCQHLELLDIGNNQIVDSFPSWLGSLVQLRVLILGSNQLSGTIRDTKGDHPLSNHFPSLQILDLASNNFSGNLPERFFNELKAMMTHVNDEGQVLGHETHSEEGFYQDTVTVTFKGVNGEACFIART